MGRRMKEKVQGSLDGVLGMLKAAFEGHEFHRLTRSVDENDLDCWSVYCCDCDEPLVMGTRDLIEMIFLDVTSSAGS